MTPAELLTGDPERVRLDVPGAGSVDGLVARVVPGAAELVLVPGDRASRRLTPRVLHRRRCRARPADGSGDRHVDGELLAVPGPDGRFHDDLVHLLFAASADDVTARISPSRAAPAAGPAYGPQDAAAQELARRRHDRVDAVRPVTLVPARLGGSGFLDLRTRDLSAGGVLLDGTAGLREGERVRVLLELTPGAILDAAGRVVRVDAREDAAAVDLDGLTAAGRARLARHVELRRAAALAALRAGG